MRKELKKIEGERKRFRGYFERYGRKNGFKGDEKTILLKDISLLDDDTYILTNHLWFNYTKSFSKLNLSEGDCVEFNGRVVKYQKGYNGYREDVYCPVKPDYKISFPTNIIKISYD